MTYVVVPHVKLTNSGLKATCTRCGEFVEWVKGMTSDGFKEITRRFAQKHRACNGDM